MHRASSRSDQRRRHRSGSVCWAPAPQRLSHKKWAAAGSRSSGRRRRRRRSPPSLEKVVAGEDPGGVTERLGGKAEAASASSRSPRRCSRRSTAASGSPDGRSTGARGGDRRAAGFDYEIRIAVRRPTGGAVAVIDGLINGDVDRASRRRFPRAEEKLVVCGTLSIPKRTRAREHRSRFGPTRKIPASILAEYRIGRDWRPAPAPEAAPTGVTEVEQLQAKRTRRRRAPQVDALAARIDLRPPNTEALRAIESPTSQHCRHRAPSAVRVVIDVATGVGRRTSLRRQSSTSRARRPQLRRRHPGRTILDKTIANFTARDPKSLPAPMDVDPLVVTADNFATVDHAGGGPRPAVHLLGPVADTSPDRTLGLPNPRSTRALRRRVHAYLRSDDLIYVRDEHHVYYGNAFSAAIRELEPAGLVGLTATPTATRLASRSSTPIPSRTPSPTASSRLPSSSGATTTRKDEQTKLADGLEVLEAKRIAVERCSDRKAPVNPVMLVIATTIESGGSRGRPA